MPKPDCQRLPISRGFKPIWRFARGTETLIVNIRASSDEKVEVWFFRDEFGEPAEVQVVDKDACEDWLLQKRAVLLAEGWRD